MNVHQSVPEVEEIVSGQGLGCVDVAVSDVVQQLQVSEPDAESRGTASADAGCGDCFPWPPALPWTCRRTPADPVPPHTVDTPIGKRQVLRPHAEVHGTDRGTQKCGHVHAASQFCVGGFSHSGRGILDRQIGPRVSYYAQSQISVCVAMSGAQSVRWGPASGSSHGQINIVEARAQQMRSSSSGNVRAGLFMAPTSFSLAPVRMCLHVQEGGNCQYPDGCGDDQCGTQPRRQFLTIQVGQSKASTQSGPERPTGNS